MTVSGGFSGKVKIYTRTPVLKKRIIFRFVFETPIVSKDILGFLNMMIPILFHDKHDIIVLS
jgi:hypothetical protein